MMNPQQQRMLVQRPKLQQVQQEQEQQVSMETIQETASWHRLRKTAAVL